MFHVHVYGPTQFKWHSHNNVCVLNAVKCSLTELTTKSTCVPLVVSDVNTYVHMSEFHVLVDRSIAYIQEAFSGVLYCGSSSPRQFSLDRSPLQVLCAFAPLL